MNSIFIKLLKKIDKPIIGISLICIIYLTATLLIWWKYSFEPSSMIHFGKEFVLQNTEFMPSSAVVEMGTDGDLGAGYDGQIFYFYSRTINTLTHNWPKGFDESYRAPRIGYPLLISLFGIFGKGGTIFGMYFWNIFLFVLSYLALRSLLGEQSYLSFFYITSPFALGSYTVLVSDTVMISLVIISYYFYEKENYFLFIGISSLAILTKEPALFLYFPLGLKELMNLKPIKIGIVLSILIIPIAWHSYLRITFPNWKPTRLADFILPLEGITTYLQTLISNSNNPSIKDLIRSLSRFPLVILLIVGVFNLFVSSWKKGFVWKFALFLNFFMIASASYYHFWSVYENVSRMFTLSIPLVLLLNKENEGRSRLIYLYISFLIFVLFFIKLIFIQKAQEYYIWN
jgi:hypothetical protein